MLKGVFLYVHAMDYEGCYNSKIIRDSIRAT